MRWMFSVGAVALAIALAQPSTAQIAGQPTAPATTPQAPPEFELGEGVLLTVNDQLITSYDLRQRMLLVIFNSQLQPTEENLPAIQQQALRALIDQRLQTQELARFEVEVSDEVVNAEIESLAQERGATGPALLAAMEQFGIRPETFREQLRNDIGWGMLVSGRYRDRARVGADQVNAVLERIEENASRPQWLIGEIYIDAATVGGMEIAMNGARQLTQQIIAGAPFQAVARQFSSAPSAASGGDGGWVVAGEPPAAVQTVLEQMNPGQLSNPIAVDGGVYIILLRDERAGSVSTLANLRQAAIRLDASATAEQVAAATATLSGLRDGLTCDNILQRAQGTPGVIGTDLGEANVSDLAPQFQEIARTGAVGSVSQPIRTPLGLHLVALCGRRSASDDIPSREDIERELGSQQLNMLARRYIRDLRNAATIEQRED
ncbi:peptidylprolyl isomerase [Brevundimonas sp.]|uniref:peptidylprolyl isomerase n=1 Tax=Brevundimonas sp. TaxID=1871086 RepID=UPI0025FC68AA|nr:peptidylprolyl isomerase [Brevundimonas sp.]